MGQEKHCRKIGDRHQLGPVPFTGKAHSVGAEHVGEGGEQSNQMGIPEGPPQEEHEHAAQEIKHHQPRPRPVQEQEIEDRQAETLKIVDIVRNIGNVPKGRHPAEEEGHPENVLALLLLDHPPRMGVALCRCGVAAGLKGLAVKNNGSEKHQAGQVQKPDTDGGLPPPFERTEPAARGCVSWLALMCVCSCRSTPCGCPRPRPRGVQKLRDDCRPVIPIVATRKGPDGLPKPRLRTALHSDGNE